MADYQHKATWEQHTRPQHQSLSQAHQLPTASAHNPWAAEARLEAHLQQALLAVQHLEHQRVQTSCPDLAANQHQ